jgi:hypothetical protein
MIKPVFLVAEGRTGTTLLMRVLASHHRIVAYEDYPLEFRPALFSLYPDYPVMRECLPANGASMASKNFSPGR